MRTYGEVIAVRPSSGAAIRSPAVIAVGSQFLWRSRVYVIRSVLAHWIESGTWWTALHQPVSASSSSSSSPKQTADDQGARRSITRDVGATERWVWRVEAAAGSSALVGVYDLACEVDVEVNTSGMAAEAGFGPTRWWLARALD